jgi:signal transduction histidine kinase
VTETANAALRATGIDILGEVAWGTHLCLFYEEQSDLLDVVVSFLAAGLLAGELCLWMAPDADTERMGRAALGDRVPDLEARIERGQLELKPADAFYRSDGSFKIDEVMAQWQASCDRARADGFTGMRASGDLGWAKDEDRRWLREYEARTHEFVKGRRMLFLCTYPVERCLAVDVFDLARSHHVVMANRRGRWESVMTPEHARAMREIERLNRDLEQRVEQATAELRRSQIYLAEGQRLTHSGSYALDVATGEYTFWSTEQFHVFGFEPGPSPPPYDAVLERLHPDDRAKCAAARTAAAAGEREVEVSFRLHHPDYRSIRHMYGVLQPVLRDGRVVEIVGSAVDITDRQRAAARLARLRRRAREHALEARVAAIIEERSRIAREIHDSLLQGVTGIALQLRALLPKVRSAGLELAESVRRIVELAETTARDARRTVWEMRPLALADADLPTALEQMARRVAGALAVEIVVEGEDRAWPADVEDVILRVAQESIANAVKHSGTPGIGLTLRFDPDSILLAVSDRGRGFDVDAALHDYLGRWGLLGMRERADRIGAALAIESRAGAGTTVTLRVPRHASGMVAGSAKRSAS